MLIHFIGNGGGRFNTLTQYEKTAGFYLETKGTRLYFDPGPGALVHAIKARVPIEKLDALLVSHAHMDHCNDMFPFIERMAGFGLKKNGVFIGSKSCIDPSFGCMTLTKYHQGVLNQCLTPNVGEKIPVGKAAVEITPAYHTDPTTIGFKIHGDKTVSYIVDTLYKEDVLAAHKGSQILIINCPFVKNPAKGQNVHYGMHLDLDDVRLFARGIKPELIILRHLTKEFIQKKGKILPKFSKEVGCKVIAPSDGYRLKL